MEQKIPILIKLSVPRSYCISGGEISQGKDFFPTIYLRNAPA